MNEEPPWNPRSVRIGEATSEDLQRLKSMSDDELLRCSMSLDLFAIAESTRRLRDALHREEKAIKWLTVVLVVLTLVLIMLAIVALLR